MVINLNPSQKFNPEFTSEGQFFGVASRLREKVLRLPPDSLQKTFHLEQVAF